jgi:hypothetical protein
MPSLNDTFAELVEDDDDPVELEQPVNEAATSAKEMIAQSIFLPFINILLLLTA